MREDQTSVEARFGRQEPVSVGPQQLDRLEGAAAPPPSRRAEQTRRHRRIDRREETAQLAIEQTGELDAHGDLGPASEQFGNEVDESTGGHRGQPEHDDLGESEGLGESDGRHMSTCRRIGIRLRRHDLDRPALGLDHPVDLLVVRDVEVGKAHAVGLHRPRRYPVAEATAPAAATVAAVRRDLLRPKWLAFHIVCAAAIVTMVSLGGWQLRRLDDKRDFNDRVRTTSDAPVADLDDLGDDVDEYRRVTARGSYLERELIVVNVSQGGTSGRDQVVALALADGTLLIVNRGFAIGAAGFPALPTGEVEVTGRVRRSQEARTGQPVDDADAQLVEIRRVDLDILAGQFDMPLHPYYLELLLENGSPVDGLQPIAFPTLDEGPHLSYAIQWYVFSVSVAVGWVFAVRRGGPSGRRRALIPEQYL